MAVSIEVETPVYQEVYERLLARLPDSDRYRRSLVTIPFSTAPVRFILTTSVYGPGVATPHKIYVNSFLQASIKPDRAKTRVELILPLHNVEIVVDNGVDTPFQYLALTTNTATIHAGIAREIYLNAQSKLDANRLAIASPFNSRLVEHHLQFQDLLPSIRSPRTHAVKMAVRSLIQNMGTEKGVRDLLTALTYSTPYVKGMEIERRGNGRSPLDLKVYPLVRRQHEFSAYELHVWLPNLCVFTWTTFIRFFNNVRGGAFDDNDRFALTQVNENQVILDVDGREERHTFDADDLSCTDTLRSLIDCFDDIRVFVDTTIESHVAFCAAAYPFDIAVEVPLGIGIYDDGSVEDDGSDYDEFNEFDPTFNGFEGDSLTGRFDADPPVCLDTYGYATRPEDLDCCFDGAAVVPLFHSGYDVPISASFALGS